MLPLTTYVELPSERWRILGCSNAKLGTFSPTFQVDICKRGNLHEATTLLGIQGLLGRLAVDRMDSRRYIDIPNCRLCGSCKEWWVSAVPSIMIQADIVQTRAAHMLAKGVRGRIPRMSIGVPASNAACAKMMCDSNNMRLTHKGNQDSNGSTRRMKEATSTMHRTSNWRASGGEIRSVQHRHGPVCAVAYTRCIDDTRMAQQPPLRLRSVADRQVYSPLSHPSSSVPHQQHFATSFFPVSLSQPSIGFSIHFVSRSIHSLNKHNKP